MAADLLTPPINVIRASLHPDGLAPRIRNLGDWRAHLLVRLEGQVERTGDRRLAALLDEIRGYPRRLGSDQARHAYNGIAVPLRVASSAGDLNLLTTVATFGTALDVTVADLSIESFYPADEATRKRLVAAAG